MHLGTKEINLRKMNFMFCQINCKIDRKKYLKLKVNMKFIQDDFKNNID